ncbi:AraC family transcriptional regulator [Actinoplanes sp. NPDC049681]|uniref:AraC family transcriptional regulator n=1 Tax=Actinoplanes sp. NPDC049681 TaxID=3363905 RepID=UPI003796FA1D
MFAGSAAVAGGRAVVSRAEEEVIVDRWASDCRQVVVKIERDFLERHLQNHLETAVRGPLQLAGELDIAAGPGRSWASVARMAAGELGNATGLLDQPLIGGPLVEMLTVGLLLADHPHREALTRPGRTYRTPPVRRAVEAIQDRPEHPFTAAELARVAGVGVRTLQAGFRRYLGCTPMEYLRDVRLAPAHDELRAADPRHTTVTAVAQRWGFFHAGRFAGAYQARYHTRPSRTLHTYWTSSCRSHTARPARSNTRTCGWCSRPGRLRPAEENVRSGGPP